MHKTTQQPIRASELSIALISPSAALMVFGLLLATLASSCSLLPLSIQQSDTLRRLTILYTNDEHGWMEGYQNTDGAAGIAGLWRERERLGDEQHVIALSGGDMWTGPALSTVWEGESMTEVMNAIGYRATAIGNHDFDFGLEVLEERNRQADFPLLSANIRESDTGKIPEFALPYLVTEINGVQLGLIGLTTTEAAVDTQPSHVRNIDFLPYRDVLPGVAAMARADGAELLMIIGHLCASETQALAPVAAEHGIFLLGGGHCHEEINEIVDEAHLFESGFFNRGYVRIELLFDTEADKIREMKTTFVRNTAGLKDPEIVQLIESWRAKTDPALWKPIGYAESSIDRKSQGMADLLLEPWLAAWPNADVALASSRYVQQDLYPGDINPATIIGLLSTTNELVEVELFGSELVETIERHQPLASGIVEEEGAWMIGGEALDPDARYKVLVPEALYWGGWYYEFFKFDPEPTFTGIDWRQPALDWIREAGSSPDNPINDLLSD